VADYTFDLQRILIGDFPLLFLVEIILRTAIMFLYLMLLLRLLGKRSLVQFSLLEFMLIIALGSAVGDPMFYPNIPVVHGMAVITGVVAIERLMIWITNRSHLLEDILEGNPQRIIEDGRFDLDGLDKALLSRNEIYMKLRLSSIEQLGQVRRSYLELNGEISIFLFAADKVRSGLPLFPKLELGEVDSLESPLSAPATGDYACLYCGEVVPLEAGQPLTDCPRCQKKEWIQADSTHTKTNLPNL
jgi:uncharacterized membrane protein YcaP (DUF421 family)/DNA-directed RNA polymerase subunit RPC12/RpoP